MGDELRAYIDGAKADGERLTQLTAQLAKANERNKELVKVHQKTSLAAQNMAKDLSVIGGKWSDATADLATANGRIADLEIDAQSIKTIGDLLRPFGWSEFKSRPISSYVRDVIAQLATAQQRIERLTADYLKSSGAYLKLYHCVATLTAERDTLRAALRPFAKAWENADPVSKSWAEHVTRLDSSHFKQAAAALGDGDKEPDCTECDVLESPEGCKHPEGYNTGDDENTGWDITGAGPGCPKRVGNKEANDEA